MARIRANTLVRPYGIGNDPRVGADPRVCPNPGIEDLTDRELPHGGDGGEHSGSPLRGDFFRRYAPKKRKKKLVNSARVLKGKEQLKSPRRRTDNTETDVVDAGLRREGVANGRTPVPREVVPRATAQQPPC